jgi:hypothetical protein
MFELVLFLLLASPFVAWCPVKIPVLVRKAATCLALAPVVAAIVLLSSAVIMRPRPLFWPALPLLLLLGTMIAAGLYSMWPNDTSRRNRAIAAIFFAGPLLILFALAGGIMYARAGTVTGTVTFKGQPLPSGKVSILSTGGAVSSGDIGPDGRYTVYRVGGGPVKLAVATYPPPPPGPVATVAPKYIPIPRRYRDFDKSALTRTVTYGWQMQDIELEP